MDTERHVPAPGFPGFPHQQDDVINETGTTVYASPFPLNPDQAYGMKDRPLPKQFSLLRAFFDFFSNALSHLKTWTVWEGVDEKHNFELRETTMCKYLRTLVIVGLVISLQQGTAQAQFLDMSQMVQNELAFQRQFYNWAWQGSVQAARHHRMTGEPIPFNAATLAESNRQTQQAYAAQNQQWYVNSARQSQAMNRFSNEAIRGNGPYQGSDGNLYNLPWTHSQYHINQYGQAVPGYNPYRVNVSPYYGR